ncbi:MAG: response regulator [Aureispira sp.]|nr:response regulator [Aureispira sp.]
MDWVAEDNSIAFADKTGNLWVKNNNKLFLINLQKNPFRVELYNKQSPYRLRGIAETKNGTFFTGGVGFLLKQENSKSASWQTTPNFQKNILGQFYDSTQNCLWLGTEYNDLYQYQVATHSYKRYSKLDSTTPTNSHLIWTTHITKNREVWAGGLGLFRVDTNLQKLVPFQNYGKYPELGESTIYDLHENSLGTWVSTSTGLYLVSLGKQVVLEKYSSASNADYYIPSNHITHVHEDKKGILWLATKGNGLLSWNLNNKSYQQYTHTNKAGLSSSILYAVYGDDYDNLWLSSNRGLMSFDKKRRLASTYLVENGLPHNEFNTISHYQAANGQIYFGGQNGLVSFHPKDFEQDTIKAPFVLTSCTKESITKKERYYNITREVLQKQPIQFLPSDKSITLQFALLDYRNPKANQYSYKIEGYDNEWNYQSEAELKITSIPYGKYQIWLRAKSAIGGDWIDYPYAIKLHVVSPFYLRWWFIGFSILFLGLLIYAVFRWRIRLLKQREAELEAIVYKRTEQVEKDKKTIEQQAKDLQALDKVKTRFFANISHELRTPLTLILGPLSYLLDNPNALNQPATIQKLQTMQKNGKSLLNLIEEILDLSKLESHKLALHEEPTLLHSFLSRIFSTFKSHAQHLGIHYQFNYTLDHNLTLALDRNKSSKIINNLLSNALKFTKKGGLVKLSVYEETNTLYIKVTDTGKGIHPDDLPHVFDRFFQAKNEAQIALGGTGIGLSLAKELATLMNGNLTVESIQGAGSSFLFTMPIKIVDLQYSFFPQINLASEEQNQDEQLLTNKEFTILLVEDNSEMRNFVGSLLLPYYHLLTASNGKKALELLESNKNQINLIISDIMMPEMDGFEFLEQLKAHDSFRNIPIVMLTARAAEHDKLKALTIGVDDYLTKPFSVGELLARTKNLLINYQERQLWQQQYTEIEKQESDKSKIEVLPKTISKEDLKWIKRVEDFVQNNLSKTIDNEGLAKEFNQSARHFSRQLKKITGLPSAKYVKTIRLQTARTYLEQNTYTSIKEIAYTLGFASVSSFSKAYKQHFGKSPSTDLK